jgi:hypothetical protein
MRFQTQDSDAAFLAVQYHFSKPQAQCDVYAVYLFRALVRSGRVVGEAVKMA